MYFLYHVLFYFMVHFKLSSTTNEKLLILAFGPYKDAKVEELEDNGAMNLNLFDFAYQDATSGAQLNIDVEYISVNCSLDFDWVNECYKRLGWEESDFEHAKPTEKYDYVLHVGPLCEYYGLEASVNEISDYIYNVEKQYGNKSTVPKDVLHFFATPSFTVFMQNGYNARTDQRINETKQILRERYGGGGSQDNIPYLVSLSGSVLNYADLAFDYAKNELSNYTALLSPIKKLAGHVDVFCRHFTETMMKRSGEVGSYFVRFHYIGEQSQDEWLEIWNQILQRSRYIIYCGNVELFTEWLKAGLNLWAPHKLTDFGIFFVNFGMNVTFPNPMPLFQRGVNDLFKGVEHMKDNVKLMSLKPQFQCNANEKTRQFCDNLAKSMGNLVNYDKDDSDLVISRFQREVYFYTLSLFNLMLKIFEHPDEFWNSIKSLNNPSTYVGLHSPTVGIYEIMREKGDFKPVEKCSFKRNGGTKCELYWNGPTPKQKPGPCGYEDCVTEQETPWGIVLIIIGVIVGICAIISGVSVFCYVRIKKKKEWSVAPLGDIRLKIEDIKPLKPAEVALKYSKPSRRKRLSQNLHRHIVLDPQVMETVPAIYVSTYILVKPFKANKSAESHVREAIVKLRELSMENVAKIHGYVVQQTPLLYGLVVESGDHGTLFSLLKLDELDLILKLPLLADLCRGLEHIHKSSLKYHGNLTSDCCVVDSHFVLKIQLNEFPSLKKLAPSEAEPPVENVERLWSAPEIIRGEALVDVQAADIYSFGIIAHEIIYQRGPFYVQARDLAGVMQSTDRQPQNEHERANLVVTILRDKRRRQIRPTLKGQQGEEAVMLILREMVKHCWEDAPAQRWRFNKIGNAIRKSMNDMKIVNVFGNMVERLEFYSKHLQEAVQQKADKVEQERKRVRHVLDQLFPGGIAKQLIDGERPKPQTYNNVCIYFNDIVGFTKICSKNTPATVVNFLNTLFVKYDGIIENYRIHPVTRIGDAYMLVSGIPFEAQAKENASEIGQAALQIVEAVKTTTFENVKFEGTDNRMKIRTGIASGQAVAGVVGKEIPSYTICGQAVTVALKMEGGGEEMKIHVAESSYNLLKDEFEFLPAKTIAVTTEAAVMIKSYWLLSRKGVGRVILDRRLDGKSSFKDRMKTASLTYHP